MNLFSNIAPNFIEILKIFWQFFFYYYGWVLFSMALIYMLFKLYRKETEHQFVHGIKWVFLNIRVPKDNLTSTLAVENMFSQMHALHRSYTFLQKYVEGSVQLWYSLEIVSLGGKISFIVRCPASYRNLFEAAVYAEYPSAEISEADDYLENIHYDPETSDFDILGTEWKITEDQAIPIKTYKDFEHPTAEEKIIDPLGNLFEALSKIEPHEFFGIQMLIQPLADEEWKPQGEIFAKQLTGEEIPHEPSLIGALAAPFNAVANFSYSKTLLGGNHGHEEQENKPRNNWLNMTEAEKERVALVQRKIGKPGYKTKIRFMYMAPKDRIDKIKRFIVVGAYRPFGSAMTNKIKVDGKTWLGVDPIISPGLEKPYLEWRLKWLKKRHFKGYKQRDIHIGASPFVLNIEEIATLYHFPITTKTTTVLSNIEKTESKKSQPPVNLPIGEF